MQTHLNITVLEQLIDSLQSCFSIEEAYTTIGPLVGKLFPNETGAIYVMNCSNNQLEAIATWGAVPLTSEPVFTPYECLAIRREQTHLVEDTHYGLVCQHIRPNFLPVETICVPMTDQGEPLGVLYVSSIQRGHIAQTKKLALTVAKHISLALANLKLRESLKNQSLRDPLTKLYHRRYLEESLEREIRRSERHPQTLGIIMIDIDQFQDFNDSFGHTASDLLLREVGMFLPSQIRASDIACRYRGQQFLLMLASASLETTKQRAEQLRHAIKYLTIQHRSQILHSITISCGVSSFSEHGLTGKAVIQAASAALNRARAQGGDRVVTS